MNDHVYRFDETVVLVYNENNIKNITRTQHIHKQQYIHNTYKASTSNNTYKTHPQTTTHTQHIQNTSTNNNTYKTHPQTTTHTQHIQNTSTNNNSRKTPSSIKATARKYVSCLKAGCIDALSTMHTMHATNAWPRSL